MKRDRSQWGLVLAWYPEYTEGRGEKQHRARIDFLREYGLKTYGMSFGELDAMTREDREDLFSLLEEYDMFITPHFGFDKITANNADIDRMAQDLIRQIQTYIGPLRSKIVTATLGGSHRYDRVMPFSKKVERFSYFFKPVAEACKEAGVLLAVENHADYYCCELVEIIKETPHLYLLLDTANALHIGEKPLQAALDAAPYTVGTHFKDHVMNRKEEGAIHYIVGGCALGDGDAELESCYRIIKENSPFANELVHLIELFKPAEMGALECFEKSLAFIEHLQTTDDQTDR